MSAHNLAMDSFWVDKGRYDEAERLYYERLAKAGSVTTLTPLADEVAKARQRLIEIRGNVEDVKSVAKETEAPPIAPQPAKPAHPEPAVKEQAPVQAEVTGSCSMSSSVDCGAIKFLEKKVVEFQDVLQKIQNQLSSFDARLISLEGRLSGGGAAQTAAPAPVCTKPAAKPEDDDDVDLFGSESEDEESAAKIKEERVAAYNAKKSKKPALIAKSSILLDIKPWDDETDMKAMEKCVRVIATDGLLWGASKLVPLAYGIHKLQINCVVEDEKVSIDWLQEEIEKNEDYVQSVDIAAFNKI